MCFNGQSMLKTILGHILKTLKILTIYHSFCDITVTENIQFVVTLYKLFYDYSYLVFYY